MRITPELIESCYQYTNKATTDREIRMRALKINAIENLGATFNQFDCFDLSDNNIRKIENLPLLPRLKCILLNNNRVCRVATNLEESVPHLERLVLTNNFIQELGDIDALSTLPNLRFLSLVNNPITSRQHYRHYVIYRLPHLRSLDFSKVKKREREDAEKLFSGVDGIELAKTIGVKSLAIDEELESELKQKNEEHRKRKRQEDAETAQLDAANMKSINRINKLLKSGYVPGSRRQQDDLMEEENIK